MADKKTFSSKVRTTVSMLCMNSDPETSKWGIYAPPGGCDIVVENVDSNTVKVLCSSCTMRSADNRRTH